MNHEQMARIQQHLMETQVSEQLRRKVAACDADTAMELEQHQRATKHFIESEVNTELRRAVAGAQASKASAAEHKDQMSSPRTPSKHVADSLVGLKSGKAVAVLLGWDAEEVRAWPLIAEDPMPVATAPETF